MKETEWNQITRFKNQEIIASEDLTYQENSFYYIKDVVSVVTENHLNYGDEGYDPYQDEGSFIIETQTAYYRDLEKKGYIHSTSSE